MVVSFFAQVRVASVAIAVVRVVMVALLLAVVSALATVMVVHWSVIIPLIAHLISDLPALLSAPELPLRLETVVPIHTDRPAIDHGFVEQVHS